MIIPAVSLTIPPVIWHAEVTSKQKHRIAGPKYPDHLVYSLCSAEGYHIGLLNVIDNLSARWSVLYYNENNDTKLNQLVIQYSSRDILVQFYCHRLTINYIHCTTSCRFERSTVRWNAHLLFMNANATEALKAVAAAKLLKNRKDRK